MAIVSSLRSFDQEHQKEFHVPIVIKDSGNPAMYGTSTLTVIIGDVNDNKMQAGSKDVLLTITWYSQTADPRRPHRPLTFEFVESSCMALADLLRGRTLDNALEKMDLLLDETKGRIQQTIMLGL